jgi:uncharacterized lipoprotein YddW (UPF0748 family)
VAVLFLFPLPAGSQPVSSPPEVRAVWVTTAAGLDWPQTTDPAEQKRSLRQIVQTLKNRHFNTIFFQVRARGDAYYRSRFEPWAENLTGTAGQDPGWDPLGTLLEEAHEAGLEVHAWFNLYKVSNSSGPRMSSPPHIALAHPEWTYMYDNEMWLDPGDPEVNTYLLRVTMDLVRGYDLDGIQFDFIRYPGQNIPDDHLYRRYGNGRRRDDWRRENINSFVATFYDSAVALKPWLKVGSAPLANFSGGNGAEPLPTAFAEYYQDPLTWLRAGKHDYIAPQIYWSLGATPGDPDFARLARLWQLRSGGRHIYAGIGVYKPEVRRELAVQVDSARAAGCAGQSFFRYDNMGDFAQLAGRYTVSATIPDMPWKPPSVPAPPASISATGVSPRSVLIQWTPPGDMRTIQRYRLYRLDAASADTFRTLLAVVDRNTSLWLDSTGVSNTPVSYEITSVDRAGNESTPASATPQVQR